MQKLNTSHNYNIIAYYLPFFLLFSQYKWKGINFGVIGLLVITVVILLKSNFKVKVSTHFKLFLIFLTYIFIRDIIKIYLGFDPVQTQLNRLFEYVLLFVMITVICSKNINEGALYKMWKIAGLIYIIGLVYHLILIHLFNQGVVPISIIPGFELRSDSFISSFRPKSFFSEPALFVTAIIPLEFMAILKKDFKWIVLVSLAILASTSTVGVVFLIVLFLSYILSSRMDLRSKITIFVILVLVVILYFNLSIFESSLIKLLDAIEGGSTFGDRVLTGFEVNRTQSLGSLLFGTNYNEVNSYISANLNQFSTDSFVYRYYVSGGVFLNTISQLIFRYGIIGLILFIFPLFKLLKYKYYSAKMYIYLVIVAMFGQTMLLNPYFFMNVIIIMIYYNLMISNRLKSSIA